MMSPPAIVHIVGISENINKPNKLAQINLEKSNGITNVTSATLRASVNNNWPIVPTKANNNSNTRC